MDKTPISEINDIFNAMTDVEWATVSVSDATKDAFLEQHGWKLEEFQIEMKKFLGVE